MAIHGGQACRHAGTQANSPPPQESTLLSTKARRDLLCTSYYSTYVGGVLLWWLVRCQSTKVRIFRKKNRSDFARGPSSGLLRVEVPK